jgi:transposase-like protein
VGKQRRKFNFEFKKQVVEAIEAGLPINEAARRNGISPSVISHWRDKFRTGTLIDRPSAREKALEKENQKLKAKIGELVVEIDVLKKVDAWIRQRRKLDTSIITEKNLAEFQKDAES